jgi:flagellar hook-associated protein FlgK
MASISSIAHSGLQAAQLKLNSAAHNVANMNTQGLRSVTVEQEAVEPQGGVRTRTGRAPQEGVALEKEVVDQMEATYSFSANLQVMKVQDRMMGSLLDTHA